MKNPIADSTDDYPTSDDYPTTYKQYKIFNVFTSSCKIKLMPRKTEGLEGIMFKERNGSNSINCLFAAMKNPLRPNWVLLKNNPLFRTIDRPNSVVGV